MQGQNENLLTSTDKNQQILIKAVQHVKNGSLEMFPLTQNRRNADSAAFSEIISEHLKT